MSEYKNTDNIYELWYRWLKTTDPKTWSEPIRRNLAPLPDQFEEWWKRCERHFLPAYDSVPLWVITNSKEYSDHHDPSDPEGELIVAINKGAPAIEIISAMQKILNNHGVTRQVGRPKFEGNDAEIFGLYKRADRPTIYLLNKMLRIYKTWVNEQQKKTTGETYMRLWEIGELEKVNQFRVSVAGDTNKTKADNRRILTAAVSRYLRQAKILRLNIVKGQTPFPNYTK